MAIYQKSKLHLDVYMLVDLLTPEYISQCLWFSNASAPPDPSFREEDFNTLLLNPKELNTTFREFSMGPVIPETETTEADNPASHWASYFIERPKEQSPGGGQRKIGLATYGKRQSSKNKQLIDRKIE